MKKNNLVFGLIAGGIVSIIMAIGVATTYQSMDFDRGMVIGYASMVIAFSFVFVGIKNHRDKYNGGVISFGKAFKTGLWITLIASTVYVAVWMVEYPLFFPDFMDKYSEHMIAKAKESGASLVEIESQTAEMTMYKDMYKNPLFVILFTYFEILPVGLVVTIISALILKRKEKKTDEMAVA
jgi:amino acid transporter